MSDGCCKHGIAAYLRCLACELAISQAEVERLKGELAEAHRENTRIKGLLPADTIDEFARRVGALHAARVKLPAPGTPEPATTRKHGSQLVPEEDRNDEDKKTAAHAAMRTPVAKAAWKALLVVAAEHGIECCEDEECYFPRCLGDGCEGEPLEPATTPDTGEGTR